MDQKVSGLVSIVIVTYGAREYLRECLDSVAGQSYPELEIIVINNSPDGEFAGKIQKDYSLVKVFFSSDNLFYCASLNKGIDLSHGRHVLCMNDDVVLDRDFIRQALEGFSIDKRIGMVSGKILRKDRKTLDSTGLFLSIWRTAKERGYAKLDSGQFEKSGFVFGVSGAVAFYRREMLDEIKEGGSYFDSRFRMFYEDLDISWRANRRGFKAYYVPTALAFHARGGSFRPDSGLDKSFARRYLNDELYRDLIKNRYLTILKNESVLSGVLHFIPVMLYDICAWGYTLLFRPGVIKLFLSDILLNP